MSGNFSRRWASIRRWWSFRELKLDDTCVLQLKPGDILLLKTTQSLSQNQIIGLKEQAKLLLPADTKVVVLDRGMELSVLRPAQITKLVTS